MSDSAWWQKAVIYQIYPRSFQDSDGDGIGDLRGIVMRLDYLVKLGVDALWISPVYPSPMKDFGYDISDYCEIDPRFGSLRDFDDLVTAARARGLKIIMDYVPNHTSDQHPWFIESRAARHDNPKRDWYVWRDPAPDGGPPNNWLSNFGGPAWTLDQSSGQYYYHAFLASQPDLNWRHPELREAMYEVLRFWLRRGVDGFRIDVLYHLLEDEQFRDNPMNPAFQSGDDPAHRILPLNTTDQRGVQQIVIEMRQVLDDFDPSGRRILIGELYLPLERLVAYYNVDGDGVLRGLQMPFNFLLISAPWHAQGIATIVRQYEAALPTGAWPNWVLGNHDKPRIASRVGERQARVAAMLLLTLRGTPTLYYGDEIGMQDVHIPADEVQDPFEKNQPGKGLGRDPQRTPMQWDASPNAGFTQGQPWLRLAEDSNGINVSKQDNDPASMLYFYRAMIALRRAEPALVDGKVEVIETDGELLAYRRSWNGRNLLVVLNLGTESIALQNALIGRTNCVLLATDAQAVQPLMEGSLLPNTGAVLLLASD